MNVASLDKLKELLHEHEGWRSHAYQDSLGYWTIGYGRLIDERKGGGISREEGEFLLGNDIRSKMNEMDERLPWWRSLDDVRQVALLDMAFNLGVAGLSNFRRMLGALEAGQYERAASEALSSRWADQVGRRADEIAEMFRTGEWPG